VAGGGCSGPGEETVEGAQEGLQKKKKPRLWTGECGLEGLTRPKDPQLRPESTFRHGKRTGPKGKEDLSIRMGGVERGLFLGRFARAAEKG